MRFLHFFINFISEIFFVSAMRRKKKAFLLYRYSNISCAMYSPTEACICSRKQALTKKHFQKILFYRFMNSMKTNWLRFTTLLSKAVIDTIEPLTDTNRINAFVVDDSLFERTSCKKTELGSKVFDHVSMRYTRVYCVRHQLFLPRADEIRS